MATAFNTTTFATHVGQPTFAPPVTASTIPNGTFVPGTKVQVGSHRVVIEKYLSEGGYAHVYLVRLPKAIDGDESAVLKRVAVPDKEALASMRTEVETMKKLKGRRHIVTYMDSHASQLKGGGYEVFLLMEYCNGGGLIDFMNTRLQNRLTEPEVLKIFSDVAQGVACMHYLKPPLLHRDLKVENILITSTGSTRLYKLCDFGSAAPPRPAATTAAEGRLIEDDVQKHTTLQYRSPEMIDLYRKQPIDEKSDIWALGVLLYKLCYYKTPFEEQGQMAILNASFKYPGYPTFSDRIKSLIASMLRENPQQRWNIYQVVREVALMRGTDIPIKDIYIGRSHSEARRNQHLPSPEPNVASPPVAGAFRAPPSEDKQNIPDITPMRRGRPTKAEGDSRVPKPSPSPLRNVESDPFAALDSVPAADQGLGVLDDASARFPALDDFTLLQDSGGKFAFDPKNEIRKQPTEHIHQLVTNYLADDAFAQPNTASRASNQFKPSTTAQHTEPRVERMPDSVSKSAISPDNTTQTPVSERPAMVSTGTMTSPQPPSPIVPKKVNSNRSDFLSPPSAASQRSSSQPRPSVMQGATSIAARTDSLKSKKPISDDHRPKSPLFTTDAPPISQPSLEVKNKSSYLGGTETIVHRSRSANAKIRPASVQIPAKPKLLRRLSRDKPWDGEAGESADNEPLLISSKTGQSSSGEEAIKIDSDVDFLKAMEEEDVSKRKEKRLSSGSRHIKRASMPSVSLSGTKSILAGRFGEAFKRFETNTGGSDLRGTSRSPIRDASELTPIAGSEATDGRSDDGNDLEESEEIPPEMRRELERRRLSQEEKRVADAAAAYRQRILENGSNSRGRAGSSKAASIQSKVQSLLDESGRASPSPTKTASGYGRFTDSSDSSDHLPTQTTTQYLPPRISSRQAPSLSPATTIPHQPSKPRPIIDATSNKSLTNNRSSSSMLAQTNLASQSPHNSVLASERLSSRPSVPPKPQTKPLNLRTGDRPPQSPAKPPSLIAKKSAPPRPQSQRQVQPEQHQKPLLTATVDAAEDDWETNFSKRYPDLAGLEMVETAIDGLPSAASTAHRPPKEMRVRDV